MAADDIFVQKLHNGLSISISYSSGFYPLGKMVYSHHDISESGECFGKRSHHIDSNLIEWYGVLANRFQGCFSLKTFSFLTDVARADIFDDILAHSWPVVVLGNADISIILT